MNEQAESQKKPKPRPHSTIIYGKGFAFIGVVAGLALVVFTPVIVTFFHDENRQWVESMPDWTMPTILVLGTGGGVLIVLVSVMFGMLLPNRVEPPDG